MSGRQISGRLRAQIEQAFARGDERSRIMRRFGVDYPTVVAVWDAMQRVSREVRDGEAIAHAETCRLFGDLDALRRELRRVRYAATHRKAA